MLLQNISPNTKGRNCICILYIYFFKLFTPNKHESTRTVQALSNLICKYVNKLTQHFLSNGLLLLYDRLLVLYKIINLGIAGTASLYQL